MKKERYAVAMIFVAFFSGMVLTAATSGCDARRRLAEDGPAYVGGSVSLGGGVVSADLAPDQIAGAR